MPDSPRFEVYTPGDTGVYTSNRGRRAFGSVLAVDDISLTARPGEVTALVGPNGSGKTNLLLMPASLLVPDRGTIRIDGHDPVTQPGLVRARIGWMPDGFGTWDALRRADCTTFTREETVVHTERTWWMLPLNPFVVVADAAPSEAPRRGQTDSGFTPMRWISQGARAARLGPTSTVRQECWVDLVADAPPPDPVAEAARDQAVWPFGLAFLLLGGAGATAVAHRRLHTPIRRLPNGTRIA
jgi:energy-coupling factor transporter ATP-binding protein EcfA2